jgi:hypothetical protein
VAAASDPYQVHKQLDNFDPAGGADSHEIGAAGIFSVKGKKRDGN